MRDKQKKSWYTILILTLTLVVALITGCSNENQKQSNNLNVTEDRLEIENGQQQKEEKQKEEKQGDELGMKTPLELIPEDYSLEQAKADGCVVYEDLDITSGQEEWDKFISEVDQKKQSEIRLAFYYTLDKDSCDSEYYEQEKDNYPQLYIEDLSFNGETYILRSFENNVDTNTIEEVIQPYKYMKKYEGKPESDTATYAYSIKYVLVNDDTITWDDIWRGMISSQLGDAVEHSIVYQDLQ